MGIFFVTQTSRYIFKGSFEIAFHVSELTDASVPSNGSYLADEAQLSVGCGRRMGSGKHRK